jgi:hypothetical protein
MKLSERIAMLVSASEMSHIEKSAVTSEGLYIAVLVGPDATTVRTWHWRKDTVREEFEGVLKVWPYPVEGVKPEMVKDNRRIGFRASWPTQRRLLYAPVKEDAALF